MSGVQTTSRTCPECGATTDRPHRLSDRWLSPWRLVPLAVTCCVIAWLVLGGLLTVKRTPVAMQGSAIVPVTPSQVVDNRWAPMLTVGDFRAIANGKPSPMFKVSDLRFWQTKGAIADMCDAPLLVAVCDSSTEASLRDEFRLGMPLRWLIARNDGGTAQVVRPFQRVPHSPYVNWSTQRIPFLPGINFVRADGRVSQIFLPVTQILVPLAIVSAAYFVAGAWILRGDANRRRRHRLRQALIAIAVVMYLFPTWTRDQVNVFGGATAFGTTKFTLSEVFSTPDTPENAREVASEIVRALDEAQKASHSTAQLPDDSVVAFGYSDLPSGATGAPTPVPPIAAEEWAIDAMPFLIASRWTMPNARPTAVGSFWNVGERGRLAYRVQTAEQVSLTFVNLGSIAALLSLLLSPVYLTWIARRVWLDWRLRGRIRRHECADCGYPLGVSPPAGSGL